MQGKEVVQIYAAPCPQNKIKKEFSMEDLWPILLKQSAL